VRGDTGGTSGGRRDGDAARKHEEKVMVYDHGRGTERSVTLEIKAPQFILDCMEQGKFSAQLVAQEAFDLPSRKFTIEVSLKVPTRANRT
jgi:hypothetical protein